MNGFEFENALRPTTNALSEIAKAINKLVDAYVAEQSKSREQTEEISKNSKEMMEKITGDFPRIMEEEK